MKNIILVVTALALMAGCAYLPGQTGNKCVNNLRMLSAATDQYALANGLQAGAQVPREKLSKYIKHGVDSLQCPDGGKYYFGIVGTPPSCSVHGPLTDANQ